MPLRRITPVALVLGLGLALAACGSDEEDTDEPDTPAESPSKEEFVAQANAICADMDAKVTEGQEALGDAPSEEDAEAFVVDVIVGEMRTTLTEIRELGFPEGDEEMLDGLMDETSEILDSIEDDPAAAMAGDDPFADINAQLNDYGLTTCGT
jgi:hypothetical protein